MSNLKAVALELRPWLIKMYEKIEVKNHSNRRISNQLESVIFGKFISSKPKIPSKKPHNIIFDGILGLKPISLPKISDIF